MNHMIPLSIEENGNQISLFYEDKGLKEHYHPQFNEEGYLVSIGMTIKGYMNEYGRKRNDFFYCQDLCNILKGLSKLYGNCIILNYKFSAENIHHQKDQPNCLGNGFNWNGETFEKSVKALTDLVNAAQEKGGTYIVDWFSMNLISTSKSKPKRRRKTNIPRGMRHEVFKRDNYTCVECGARKEDGAVLHIDHKIPVSKGGTDELSNLQTLCADCNLNKSNVIQKVN